jgi:hypothetical protein
VDVAAAFYVRKGPMQKQKSLRRTITGAAQKNTGLSSTNADAQESPVVLQTHPTAGEKISDGRNRLSVAARTGADCQDQITQRQTREFSWLQNLSISFHTIASVSDSNFNTIPICEYLIHTPHVVIHPLCTLRLTARRHFCSIFKHKILSACSSRERDLGEAPTTERPLARPSKSKRDV